MRHIIGLLIVLCPTFVFSANSKAELSNVPLSSDQIAVYRAFLDGYSKGSKTTLNLAEETDPLDLANLQPGKGCLRGIKIDAHSGQAIHRFISEFKIDGQIRLVNPEAQVKRVRVNDPGDAIQQGKSVEDAVKAGFASGLLTFSEVVFDRTGRYGVMSFSFVCGGLCGHGGTVIFEKSKSGTWKRTKRMCSSWIS